MAVTFLETDLEEECCVFCMSFLLSCCFLLCLSVLEYRKAKQMVNKEYSTINQKIVLKI